MFFEGNICFEEVSLLSDLNSIGSGSVMIMTGQRGLDSTDWEGILWYSIRMPGYSIDMDLFSYCILYV